MDALTLGNYALKTQKSPRHVDSKHRPDMLYLLSTFPNHELITVTRVLDRLVVSDHTIAKGILY